MQFKTEIEFSDDIEAAPKLTRLLIMTNNGFWFMRRDEVGQWRSLIGRPKPAPLLWALSPKDPRK